ncbi:MAG: hypothetical protein KDA28_15570, partial [Phycisphaerales bacterium]|nr:hypothetical protein [Phycisphaerales bacterium]
MAESVWTGLVKGILSFGQTRAAQLVGDSFSDTGSFVGALAEGDGISPEVKQRFETLKTDIEQLVNAVQPIVNAVKPKIDAAKTAVQNMAAELQTSPFTLEAAARAAIELGFVLKAVDEALEVLATEISKDQNGTVQPAIRDAILGMREPWAMPFRNIASDVTKAFDLVAKQVLDIDDAGSKFAERVEYDRAGKELRIEFAKADRRSLGIVSLEQTTLVGFLNFKEHAILGVRLRTRLEAGLRSDKLLEKVIPDGANPSADSTAIQLDTDDGLTFGDGKNKR